MESSREHAEVGAKAWCLLVHVEACLSPWVESFQRKSTIIHLPSVKLSGFRDFKGFRGSELSMCGPS